MPVVESSVQKITKSDSHPHPETSATPIPNPSDDYIPKLRNRTPEQLERDRAALVSHDHKPRPLPPGKTVWDMIVGQWPGDETDEEIAAALEELS